METNTETEQAIRDMPLPEQDTIPSAIDEANKTVAALKAENDRTEELAQRLEKARAVQIISGNADAGQVPEQISNEQVVKDRVNKLLDGTGMQI